MKPRFLALAAALIGVSALALGVAEARPLKWAAAGDALTIDPHGQNEGPTTSLNQHMYESLTERDHAGKLGPLLATSWRVLPDDPTTWEFKLQDGVKFHDGAPFTADDVVFSYERAMQPTSDFKGYLTSIEKVSKVDDLTVRIKTKGPNPLLVNNTSSIRIMSKAWAEKNNAVKAQDFKNKEENFAVRNANGTGPFVLVSREADVKTVMKRNDAYWNKAKVPLEITELTLVPIKQDATRIAALLSGEVDFVQDVPVQDIARLKNQPKVRVTSGPENRTIFFGMDVASADLKGDDVQGKNPFADKRVRQALNMAINRPAIQRVVMRGESVPTGIIMPPFVNGWTKELDAAPATDVAKAKSLLAEAGYPNGFSTTLHCSNDRYVNDEGICQAAVGMFGQIGVKVNLVSQSKSIHFNLIQKNPAETEFYLVGWGVPTYDSDYIFSYMYHTRTGSQGSWNATGYSDKDVDGMIQSLSREVDLTKRNATIASLWTKLKDETIYLPIHHQSLSYGMNSTLDIPVDVANNPKLKMVSFKGS
ncbi:ABC transporter substrate-binding protein [Bosea caraganae]|uniref:ABC transporter substrate-binding protein n=1 Tax=Bosea caraganae TaxID=2763117 RepID=A0A370L4K2_9HYPH|nr:ABC transporter substrate-binding protein [Bosea caraganae]RDJ22352.1 ABC transporter substrate-binding protein [Bosea caraganae]RDJ23714.1 ABC transporter substrate-binding protein [Bosea caraganae]